MRLLGQVRLPCLALALTLSVTGVFAARADDPHEPNDTPVNATSISYNYASEGTEIAPEDDVDLYRFSGARGEVVEIRAVNAPGSALDGRIWLMTADGQVLAQNDDDSSSLDSRITAILAEDATYLVRYAFRLNNPPLGIAPEAREGRPRPSSQQSALPALPAKAAAVAGTSETGFAAEPGNLRDAVGAYTLTLRTVAAPPATDLFTGSGFAETVPLTWAAPMVTILGDGSAVANVERSANGGADFVVVGSSTNEGFLDTSAAAGQELVYRIRMDYPEGVPSAFSESATATPTRDGHQVTSPFTATPPVIDGSIDAQEWSTAVQIPLIDEGTRSKSATLYLMNDTEYLYLATDHLGRTAEIGVYFDSNNDGTYGFSGEEGNYWVTEDREVLFRSILGAYPDPEFEESELTPLGVTAGQSVSGLRSQYEVRFDLKASRLRVGPGDVIGIYAYDLSNGRFAGYPAGPGEVIFIAPTTFADVTLQAPLPQVFLPVTSVEFGEVAVGSNQTILVTVENRGVAQLEISEFAMLGTDADQFTVETGLPVFVAPGSSTQVSTRFAPRSHGDFSATLAITSNDPQSPAEVHLLGRSVNQPPLVQVRNPASSANAGQPLPVEAQANDDLLLASVSCEYVSGSGEVGEVVMVVETGDTYRAAIPGNAITAAGLHYRVVASDGEGGSTHTTHYEVIVQTARLEGPALPGGSEQTGYRLISVPSLLDDDGAGVFSGSFGPYDPKSWRLFSLAAGEYEEQSNRQQIAPGEALWLIVRGGGALRTNAGESVTQSAPFAIPLEAGWTLVGNPFAYSVSPSQLRLAGGGTVDIRAYDEGWSLQTSGLIPWEGYAVFSESADQLLVDPQQPFRPFDGERSPWSIGAHETSSSAAVPATPIPEPSVAEGSKVTAGESTEWRIGIAARCQSARDRDNVLGVHPDASSGRDRFDLPEPPPIGEYVSVFFPHEDFASVARRFCTDMREPAENLSWTFQVCSNIDDAIELEFDASSVPGHLLAWVRDRTTGVVRDLRVETRLEMGPVIEHPRSFDLFVGDAQSVEDAVENASPDLTLAVDHLGFPNPSRGVVTIFYQATKPGLVNVDIYSIGGQRMRTLEDRVPNTAGRRALVWDGRDQLGGMLPSGSYFYRIVGESTTATATGRLVLIR